MVEDRSTKQKLSDKLASVDASLADIATDVKNLGAVGDGVTDDTTAIKNAINSLPNGGTVLFQSGKVYITDTISIPSNITLDLNTSTLKLKANVPDYHNLINIGGSSLVKNVKVKNGKLDGNRSNQTQDFFRYGVYPINCDGVYLENLEIVSCDGEGIFVGYTGYLAKNIFLKNIKLSDNTRNDIAITNADSVFGDNVIITSTATDSACIDLELQSNSDTIKNIYLNNFVVNSANQPMKLISNNHTGVMDNVNISNFKFTGVKGLSIQSFDNVKIRNLDTVAGVEIIGSKNISVNGFKAKGINGNGLYLYPDASSRTCENIILDGLDISGCTSYGLLLQGMVNSQVANTKTYNNVSAGIGIMYTNINLHLANVISTDNQATKTQKYGIEFQGTNTGIVLVDVYTAGNLTSNTLNYPTVIFEMNNTSIRFISPDGTNSFSLALDNLFNLTWSGQLKAKKFAIKQTVASNTVATGELFEDSADNKLKYMNQSGTILNLGRNVSVPASATAGGYPGDWSTDSSYLYVCTAFNTWKRVAIAAW